MGKYDAIRERWATHPNDLQFANQPVDWWDIDARLWRCTMLIELEPGISRRTHAVVFVPADNGMERKRVAIERLRPSDPVRPEVTAWFRCLPERDLCLQLLQPGSTSRIQAVDATGRVLSREEMEAEAARRLLDFEQLRSAWQTVFERGEGRDIQVKPELWGFDSH